MSPNLNAILHGQNSTTQALWHPNPTVRGTWNIYQTCIVGKSRRESEHHWRVADIFSMYFTRTFLCI